MPPPTTYKCENGHECYSYSGTALRLCPYPNCTAMPLPISGPLARKKERP